MKVDDVVRIKKCESCPDIVGKTATITGVVKDGFALNFGRGRPQTGRPSVFAQNELTLVKGGS